VSATLAAYVKLIMKVSYNRGADLMTCLAAVKTGSTDCEQGLVAEVNTATTLGVPKDQMMPFDGAGSDDQSRVTATALATFYKQATQTPYATVLAGSLPILGKDGTLANVLPDSPAAGKVQMKTGNRVAGTEAGQIIVLGNSLAGTSRPERPAAHLHGRREQRPIATAGSNKSPQTRRRWPSPSSSLLTHRSGSSWCGVKRSPDPGSTVTALVVAVPADGEGRDPCRHPQSQRELPGPREGRRRQGIGR
jgi:hypothetical protein